jgi:hypothetical protein
MITLAQQEWDRILGARSLTTANMNSVICIPQRQNIRPCFILILCDILFCYLFDSLHSVLCLVEFIRIVTDCVQISCN